MENKLVYGKANFDNMLKYRLGRFFSSVTILFLYIPLVVVVNLFLGEEICNKIWLGIVILFFLSLIGLMIITHLYHRFSIGFEIDKIEQTIVFYMSDETTISLKLSEIEHTIVQTKATSCNIYHKQTGFFLDSIIVGITSSSETVRLMKFFDENIDYREKKSKR